MSARGWALPGAAASFGLGVLVLGGRVGRTGGVALAACGLLVLAAVAALALGSERRREASDTLLGAAGLLPGAADKGLGGSPLGWGPGGSPRKRIMRAAGMGYRREPVRGATGATGWRLVVLPLMGLSLVGAGWAAVRAPPVEALQALEGRRAVLRGTASTDVRVFDTGWGLEVAVNRLTLGGSAAAQVDLRARLWLRGRSVPPPVEAGQAVEAEGSLAALRPGGGGFEDYLRDRGVVATLTVSRVEALGPPANPALRLANESRRFLRRGARAVLPAREAELLLGLSIGDVSRMDPEVEEDFRASGLGHLVAVSGSNVAMFLAPLLALATALRASGAVRLLVGLVGVGFFALVTRWEPSVLRASAMAALALAAAFSGRPRSSAPLLGGAVLLLLVGDPWLSRSIGFQLSVAATAGIVALAGPLASRMWWLPRPVALTAGATIGAQVAVSPLLLLRFEVVPSATLLANVLAFPAVPLSLAGGLAAAGVAHVWVPAGRGLGLLVGIPLGYLVEVADRSARAPLPQIVSDGPALPVMAAVLGGVAVWRLRRGRRRVGSLVVLLLVGALLWPVGGRAGPPSRLTVTFLDVGQGDSAVVRTPDGATILVDAGPDRQQVARSLAGLGVRRIDLAVVSHAHADHVEGFPAVFARFPVSLLVEPGCPWDSPPYRRMVEAAADEEIPVRHPRGGERLEVGTLAIEVLGPDECIEQGPNNDSLVLLMHPAGKEEHAVLFTGDAEEPAQRDLLEDGDPVAATVMKVPHQGGATSLEEFFDAVRAEVAVVSVGPNEYGHPVPSILAALRRSGALVLRTDQAGDVTVRFGAEGVLVESAR